VSPKEFEEFLKMYNIEASPLEIHAMMRNIIPGIRMGGAFKLGDGRGGEG